MKKILDVWYETWYLIWVRKKTKQSSTLTSAHLVSGLGLYYTGIIEIILRYCIGCLSETGKNDENNECDNRVWILSTLFLRKI